MVKIPDLTRFFSDTYVTHSYINSELKPVRVDPDMHNRSAFP